MKLTAFTSCQEWYNAMPKLKVIKLITAADSQEKPPLPGGRRFAGRTGCGCILSDLWPCLI
jgi:hypothetical protein